PGYLAPRPHAQVGGPEPVGERHGLAGTATVARWGLRISVRVHDLTSVRPGCRQGAARVPRGCRQGAARVPGVPPGCHQGATWCPRVWWHPPADEIQYTVHKIR